jgi:hypothetical protein
MVMPLRRTFRVMDTAEEATPGVELSVAVRVSGKEPPDVGVPVRTPVRLRLKPVGKPAADHV